MCYIADENVRADIRKLIEWKVSRRKTFTGISVTEKLHSASVHAPHWHISSYVRELFNTNHDVFGGYGCYPMPDGPLVFFPIPGFVKKHAEKIQEAIESAKSSEG